MKTLRILATLVLATVCLCAHMLGGNQIKKTQLKVPGHDFFSELQGVKFIKTTLDGSVTFALFSDRATSGVYVFQDVNNSGNWEFVQVIRPEDIRYRDGFGAAISYDYASKTMVIAAPYKNGYKGSVYLYKLGQNSQWQYFSQYDFVPEPTANNTLFGYSLYMKSTDSAPNCNYPSCYCSKTYGDYPCYKILVGCVPSDKNDFIQTLYLTNNVTFNNDNSRTITPSWKKDGEDHHLPAKYIVKEKTDSYGRNEFLLSGDRWNQGGYVPTIFEGTMDGSGGLHYNANEKSTSASDPYSANPDYFSPRFYTLSTKTSNSVYYNSLDSGSGRLSPKTPLEYYDFGHTVVSTANLIFSRNVITPNGSSELVLYGFPPSQCASSKSYKNPPDELFRMAFDEKLGDDIPGKPIDIYTYCDYYSNSWQQHAVILKAQNKRVWIVDMPLYGSGPVNDGSVLAPSLLITTALLITTLFGF